MKIAIAAILYGAIAAVIFRLTTNPKRLRQTTNQILARILEFRLFLDEPALIARAQFEALKANLTLLRQIAIPTLIMAALFAILYPTLSRGQPTVLTARTDTPPHIEGITIETQGVRIERTGEVVYRIRPTGQIGSLPSGVQIQYPKTTAWLLPFFLISTLTATVGHALLKRIRPLNTR